MNPQRILRESSENPEGNRDNLEEISKNIEAI